MTGLPASGKTALGRALSDSLRLPFMDKDGVLETLFDALGADSPEDRSRLSRASDAVLQSMALASQGAVLASFWHVAPVCRAPPELPPSGYRRWTQTQSSKCCASATPP